MFTRLYSQALLVAAILSLVICPKTNHAQSSLEFDHLDQLTLQVTYTDGSTFDVDLHGTALEESYADAYTRCEVSLSSVDFGSEVHFSLTALKPKPIKFVDLVFEYDDAFMTKDVVFYDNGFHTNYTSKIMKPSAHGHVSRELVLLKNKKTGEHLNIAFGSFKRFYTYFKTNKDKVIARNHMEDRPLKLGEVYNLEPIIFDDALPGDRFFAQYATLLGERNKVKLKPVVHVYACSLLVMPAVNFPEWSSVLESDMRLSDQERGSYKIKYNLQGQDMLDTDSVIPGLEMNFNLNTTDDLFVWPNGAVRKSLNQKLHALQRAAVSARILEQTADYVRVETINDYLAPNKKGYRHTGLYTVLPSGIIHVENQIDKLKFAKADYCFRIGIRLPMLKSFD